MLKPTGLLDQFEHFEPDQTKAFSKLNTKIDAEIGQIIDDFYSIIGRDPDFSSFLAKGPGVSALKTAQHDHWRALLTGEVNDELRRRGRRIGAAHVRIGLPPKHYIASYAFVVERLIAAILGKGPNTAAVTAVVKAIMIDMELALSNYLDMANAEVKRKELEHFTSAIDEELTQSSKLVDRMIGEIGSALSRLGATMDDVEKAETILDKSAETASGATQSVAAAVEEMHASSQEVGAQAQKVSQLANSVVSETELAEKSMSDLTTSASHIADVTQLIDGISRQTNLLALNATIEAARAGEAGSGFAVVASEVKALSQRSTAAAKEISNQIDSVRQAVDSTVRVVQKIAEMVHEVGPAVNAVTQNVGYQIDSLNELASSAQLAAENVESQANAVQMLSDAVNGAKTSTDEVNFANSRIQKTFGRLNTRLKVTVKSFGDLDAREDPRVPLKLPINCEVDGANFQGTTLNVSPGGCLLTQVKESYQEGTRIKLSMPQVGEIEGVIQGTHPYGLRIQFIRRNRATEESLQALLARSIAANAHFKKKLIQTREQVEAAFERGIGAGQVSLEDLFDDDYVVIKGTNPEQVTTKSLSFLESILPSIQEPAAAFDSHVVFCAAVDRNGYLPVHNAAFSKPQGDDPDWNNANSRNRRIFDDIVGLSAARNVKELLEQTYPRDMGGGRIDFMVDVSTPIKVRNQHWGSLRMAIKF
ncbi:MAG: methyl-accepting chemotaxis protein [Filomicrobium sp.]